MPIDSRPNPVLPNWEPDVVARASRPIDAHEPDLEPAKPAKPAKPASKGLNSEVVDQWWTTERPNPGGQASSTAFTNLASVSFASPNSRVVLSSKRRSLSIPANPGRIERFRKMTLAASSALMIGMP